MFAKEDVAGSGKELELLDHLDVGSGGFYNLLIRSLYFVHCVTFSLREDHVQDEMTVLLLG